jgi:hypothetical protein
MSLVDLKSDLSKYRSEVSKESKNTPDASSATSDKNFATQQPITDELYKDVPKIKKPKVVSLTSQLSKTKFDDIKTPKQTDVTKRLNSTELDNTKKPNKTDLTKKLDSTKFDDIVIPSDKRVQLEDRLSSTKLDDIVQNAVESLLINSVSGLSPAQIERSLGIAGGIGLDQIESKFSSINQTRFSSRLTESEIEVSRSVLGENNTSSDIDPIRQPLTFERDGTSPDINVIDNDAVDNITDPKTIINIPQQTFNRDDQAVTVNKNILSPIGNISNPLIPITRPAQFFDRTETTVEIKRDSNDSSDNIIVPDIEPLIKPLSFNRQEQTPNIITETIKEGLVVNPNINVLRMDQGSIHVGDGSEFNIDNLPIKFVGTSELEKLFKDEDDKGPIRYEGKTIHDADTSQFNLDGITPTMPTGRHEKPQDSLYSILGLQEVNFFSDQFALGFNQRQRVGDSKYIGFSQYVWTGASDDGPFTNYFGDKNGTGFQIKIDPSETSYQPNSSQYDFTKITGVNFFDGNNNNTIGGFSVFTPHQITEYKTETSFLGWQGNRIGAPATNFFDIGLLNTKSGFTKFAELGESNYIPDSSYLDWDGNAQQSPSVNYFDLTGASSTMGFHNFAAFQDSKYILDASNYVWKGVSTTDAPQVNFFDLDKGFTSTGFHVFAQKYDSKYLRDSSGFVWNGNRADAPPVNFFDLTAGKTFDGFTTFAQTYESLYVPDSSRFTWVGTREEAPFVNYLDIPTRNVLSGFDIFTPFLESKYKNESSTHTWNANRQDAPVVNYFDLQNQSTTTGFHKFSGLYDTKYIKDSSQFDFDGNKQQAPAVNYFDLLGKFTTVGFHTFPIFKESKYIKDSSEFDWNGSRIDAPAINYFDLQGTHTSTGFYTFALEYDSKYVKESSRFDWDGNRGSAPAVNYFDLPGKFTTDGFHTLAPFKQTKYIHESSDFDWNGARSESPEVNFFDISKKVTTAGFHRLAEIYDTKYVPEISIFDWDGSRDESPQINYFDLPGKFTTIGFHRLAEIYDSKYIKDSSEFTFKGKFPEAGIDYFDKEKLNQTGFTLNIQPKGTGKPAGTEYFHESSFYTFKGGRPGDPVESVIDFFQNTNQTGFTMDIKRNEGLPGTEYATESSIFTFQGGRPGLQSFFPDDNQTGFTLDIMAKGSSRPGTEYETDSSEYGFKANRRPPLLNYFPDDNQTGFTLDIMPKGAGNPETEYVNESSRFGFAGLRPSGVNYFPDDNQTGFTIDIMRKGSGRPGTEYSTQSSEFDWNGTRINAPSNNYFGLYRTPTGKEYIDVQQKNNTTQAGRGFQTFYTDKTTTNYAPGYSILSTESGPNKLNVFGSSPKPVTNFFGFTSTRRAGFMPNMTQNDGTLYPIINPELTYNLEQSGRLSVATARSSADMRTVKEAEFAPLSLGKRPWAQQGTLASLENQVPNIKTKASAASYLNKYERTLKDSTDNTGYLSKYGVEQGQLDLQYKKFSLADDAYNPSGPGVYPFILRGIQLKGNTKNEIWGDPSIYFEGEGELGTVDPTRSGVFNAINTADLNRIEKWLKTPKGIFWVDLQNQLYNNNPLVDSITGIDSNGESKTRRFNKKSLENTILKNGSGNRALYIRHGDDIDPGKPNLRLFDGYEDVANYMNPSSAGEKQFVMDFPRSVGNNLYATSIKQDNIYEYYKYNRLIALMAELLPSSFAPVNKNLSGDIRTQALSTTRKIIRLSGLGGPNSGTKLDGETVINRASHPFMVTYNTSGVLPDHYPTTAKRETWFGPNSKISGTTETDNTYSGKMKDPDRLSSNTFDGILTALSYILGGPVFEGKESTQYPQENGAPKDSALIQPNVLTLLQSKTPFEPKYPSFEDRLRANAVFDPSGVNTTPNAVNKILDGPPSGETQDSVPIKHYSTVAYGKLKKVARGDANRLRDYNDFRADLDGEKYKKFSSDPSVIDYKSNNLDNRFGFGLQGKPGVDRSKPFKTNITYGGGKPQLKSGAEFRGDRINIIDYKKQRDKIPLAELEDFVYERGKYKAGNLPDGEDLITFYFTSVNLVPIGQRPAEAIVFRATFDSITDNHKPSWSPQMYMGRGDPTYVFGGYERDVSFGFVVHIGSRDEMAATWRKLNYLASWTAPDYSYGRMRAPLCRLNIGHLFRKTPGFINSLSYTFDNAGGTWETAKLKEDRDYNNEESKPGALQLPKTIQVAVGFTIIGNYRPERNGAMYSLYEDKGDGLVPITNSNDVLVNYFRVDDTPDQDNDDNKFVEQTVSADKFTEIGQSEEEKQLAADAMQKQGIPVLSEKKDDKGNPTGEYEVPAGTAGAEKFVVPLTADEQKERDEYKKNYEAQEKAAKDANDKFAKEQADRDAKKKADADAAAAANGSVVTTNPQGTPEGSDIRIKENIRPIEYGLDDILKLNPVQYNMIADGDEQVGFIAQEMLKIIPEVVYGTEGDLENGEILKLSYAHLTSVLVKAVQEQQMMIEEQRNKIEKLESVVNNIVNKND